MDVNKDEALRCLSIGKKYLNQNDKTLAAKFIKKAKRLYPPLDISSFDSLFQEEGSNKTERRGTRTAQENKPRSRSNSRSESTFTKSQIDSVRKVLACKDYYEMLGVTKGCTESELKKAYRVLALKFHPDKNQAPGATEAFKKIGKAMNVLSDPDKRRRYDQYGTAEDQPSIQNRREDVFYQYDTHQGFDADVFNMFFNGRFPFAEFKRTHTRQHHHSHESERDNNYFVYIQLLPLIILFGMSFFSGMMVKEPYYSLQRTQKFHMEKWTSNFKVPYFVKSSFSQDYDGSMTQLEKQIEDEYITNLKFRCFREKEYKENLIYRARYFGDEEAYVRASKTDVPSCDRLHLLIGRS